MKKRGSESGRCDGMLAFLGGTLLGGALGVVTMCLVQINRD